METKKITESYSKQLIIFIISLLIGISILAVSIYFFVSEYSSFFDDYKNVTYFWLGFLLVCSMTIGSGIILTSLLLILKIAFNIKSKYEFNNSIEDTIIKTKGV